MPKEQDKNKESFWRQGVMLFSEVSSWIVGPVILALILGKYLDNKFDTKPFIFLGLTFFSFLVSCYGIFKIVNKYIENIKNQNIGESEETKDNN